MRSMLMVTKLSARRLELNAFELAICILEINNISQESMH